MQEHLPLFLVCLKSCLVFSDENFPHSLAIPKIWGRNSSDNNKYLTIIILMRIVIYFTLNTGVH